MFTTGQFVNDRYRILNEVAQGDLGPVYRALEVSSGRICALKLITLQGAAESSRLERLREEAQRISRLQHPNVAPVGEIGETADHHTFIVRQFIEGGGLEVLLRDEAPLPLPRACSIAKQIALALEAAHHGGMIHGDLKPSNVLLAREGEKETVKVLGFGNFILKQDLFVDMARLAVKGDGHRILGSAEYVSPEQAVGISAEALDGRTDLYSLGVILYQMLSGHLPIQGQGAMEILLGHAFADSPPLSDYPELEIPEVIDTLVMRTLAKKRQERPASATVLIDQLGAWEEPEPLRQAPARERVATARDPALTSASSKPAPPEPEFELPGTRQPAMADSAEPVEAVREPRQQSFVADLKANVSPASPQPPQPDVGHIDIRRPGGEKPTPVSSVNLTKDAVQPPGGGDHSPPEGGKADIGPGVTTTRQDSGISGDAVRGIFQYARQPKTSSVEPTLQIFKHHLLRQEAKARQKSSHRWAIAAIVILMVLGSGCGWLYYTGRSYWFRPHFVKWRVSTLFSSRSLETVPAAETSPPRSAPPAPHPAAPQSTATPPPAQTVPLTAGSASVPAASSHVPSSTPASQPENTAMATPRPQTVSPETRADRQGSAGDQQFKISAPSPSHRAKAKAGLAAESIAVQDAITRGEYYFERGDYDSAIRAYEDGLAREPLNRKLLAEIARARRAKAAEAKYLQQ